VEKLIQWAKDAARLECSPSSDNDDDRATLAAMSATCGEQRESIEREEEEENGRRRRGGGAKVRVFFFFFGVFSSLQTLPRAVWPVSMQHTPHFARCSKKKSKQDLAVRSYSKIDLSEQ
jgi:hypothetical protein